MLIIGDTLTTPKGEGIIEKIINTKDVLYNDIPAFFGVRIPSFSELQYFSADDKGLLINQP